MEIRMEKIISNRRRLPGGGESFDVKCIGEITRTSILTAADREQMEQVKREFSRVTGGRGDVS
jgi:hypothetical protein